MEWNGHHRPRVARETRLLVTTALLAVVALWLLARVRFPNPPAAPRALASLVDARPTGDGFDALALQVARAEATTSAYLVAVPLDGSATEGDPRAIRSATPAAALRIGDATAVAYLPPGTTPIATAGMAVVAWDRASNLAVLRLPSSTAPLSMVPVVARLASSPQFLLLTVPHAAGVAVAPLFVPTATMVDVPLWSSSGWALPGATGVSPGSFVFNRQGELVGMMVEHHGTPTVVPAATLLRDAQRLSAAPPSGSLDLGIGVQTLTPSLATALGTRVGVAVSWVDPAGPANGRVSPGDVIETVDGQPMTTVDHWRRKTAGFLPDATVALGLSRRGARQTVLIAPAAKRVPPSSPSSRSVLGASLVAGGTEGVEVTAVETDSVAFRAGLRVGDAITMLDTTAAPTPAQVMASIERLQLGQSRVIAVRRGDQGVLLVLER